MLIVTPLSWITVYYLPHIKTLLNTLQDIEFPDTTKIRETWKKIQEAVSLTPQIDENPEESQISEESPVFDTTQPKAQEDEQKITPERKIAQSVIKTTEVHEEKPLSSKTLETKNDTWENIAIKEKTYKKNNSQKTKLSNDEQIKLNKKIETIKYTAMASKERWKLEQYEKKLVEWLALDSGNIDFLNMLSTHYFDSRQQIKALTLLKKVVNKEPKNHKAIWQIGKIYTQQWQFETAQLLIEKAIILKNDHPKYYISLVEIWYETWKIQKAIQTMEKLLKLRPTNTDYLLTMATLYEEDQKPTHAWKYFWKVLELDPVNIHAKKWIKRVK